LLLLVFASRHGLRAPARGPGTGPRSLSSHHGGAAERRRNGIARTHALSGATALKVTLQSNNNCDRRTTFEQPGDDYLMRLGVAQNNTAETRGDEHGG